MQNYKIQLKNGTTITANNVTDIWNNEYGISFDAGKKTVAYVPHNNLANYQLVEKKPVSSIVTTTVGKSEVTFDGNTLYLSADKINLGSGVVIKAKKEHNEEPLAIITPENINLIKFVSVNGKKMVYIGDKFIGEIVE